ncbi:MAG TPA: hypothetical protein VKV74_19045 [Bryobacteraceae bacterium]|nr:hypothetical protein [Bryobacteraceae bacterium]
MTLLPTSALLLFLPLLARSEVLDRIAVTIGSQVIAESDVIRELRVDAFLDGKAVDLSPEAKRKAAERLVDQILILQEVEESHVTLASAEDAAKMVQQEKSKFAGEEEYRAALAKYQIAEKDLSEHLLNGLRELRFTDLRFRPVVQLSDADLRSYYDKLAAGWRNAGRASIPTFEESRAQVEQLLTEQRTMAALDQWLETARAAKAIRYREDAFK